MPRSMDGSGEAVLRINDGRKITVGSCEEFKRAAREIVDSTGGSSWGGALSYLWGFLLDSPGDLSPLTPEEAERVAREAAEFQASAPTGLTDGANALLHRIASLIPTDYDPEPGL